MNQFIQTSFQSRGKIWFFQILINFLITFPVIFNFYLIPKIERRVGEKLNYVNPIYSYQIFARWFLPPMEIAPAIFINYLILKFLGRNSGKTWGFNKKSFNALQQIHYDIREATAIEVFIAIIVTLDLVSFWIMMILYLVGKLQ